MNKPQVFRVHFNRIAMQRRDPLVWSVQLSDRCLHGSKVVMVGRIQTEFKPERRTNPRAFVSGRGYVRQQGDTIYVEAT
jgi:hypothetical protein